MSEKKNALISNVGPPSQLPNFILQSTSPQSPSKNTEKTVVEETKSTSPTKNEVKDSEDSKFSPAIPIEKNTALPNQQVEKLTLKENVAQSPSKEDSSAVEQEILNALSPITQGGNALFGWMKDTVKTGVQKAKTSVDNIVVTLDPQMKEIIYSGGDVEVFVTSDKDDKIKPVREAFQSVFGKATVCGFSSQSSTIAAQPVGFESALKSAEERISNLRKNEEYANKVLVSVENFLVEPFKDEWFDVGLLVLSDPQHNLNLKSFTQMTFIPSYIVTNLQAETPADYEFKNSGFSTTIGSLMARNLNTNHSEWHKTYTTISRCDMILNAAKSLASIYKLEVTTIKQRNELKI